MGHLYHGYVSHNQMVKVKSQGDLGWPATSFSAIVTPYFPQDADGWQHSLSSARHVHMYMIVYVIICLHNTYIHVYNMYIYIYIHVYLATVSHFVRGMDSQHLKWSSRLCEKNMYPFKRHGFGAEQQTPSIYVIWHPWGIQNIGAFQVPPFFRGFTYISPCLGG